MQNVEWGEFRIGDLFEKLSSKYFGVLDKFNAVSRVKNDIYSIPVVYAKSGDNGIMYWAKDGDFQVHKNVLSIVYNGAIAAGLVYAHQNETGILAESYFIRLKNHDVTFRVNLFLQRALEKVLHMKYSREYLATWTGKVENDKIQLPIRNGEIDFEFMENFIAELEAQRIAELEAQRIAELEAYLLATGLKDFNLTNEELQALDNFNKESKNVEWGDFKLGGDGGLFEIVSTKSLDSNAIDFITTGINFVGRTYENNGVQGKIQKREFEPNEPFTITATVIGNYKYVKYQTESYYCSQNINKLTPTSIFNKWNKKIAYYLIAGIQKFVSIYDGQQGGYKLEDIKSHKVKLPTKNGEIDFEFMESFISAIQKLVIKDVVAYADNKIQATKHIVNHGEI